MSADVDEAREALLEYDEGREMFRWYVDALIAAVRAESAETLRALREAAADVVNEWYWTIRDGGLVTISVAQPMDNLRAALAATPAEEGRTLVCERNESVASAHGHTAECYR